MKSAQPNLSRALVCILMSFAVHVPNVAAQQGLPPNSGLPSLPTVPPQREPPIGQGRDSGVHPGYPCPNPYDKIPAVFPSIGLPYFGPQGYAGSYALPYDGGMQSRASFRYMDMSDAGFHVDPYATHTTGQVSDPSATVPGGIATFVDEANRAFLEERYLDAMRLNMHAVLEDPSDPGLRFRLSQCSLAQGDYVAAARELITALEQSDPDEWLAELTMLRSWYGNNIRAYQRQIHALSDFCETNESDGNTLLLWAFHQLDTGNGARVTEVLRKVTAENPDLAKVSRGLLGILAGIPSHAAGEEQGIYLPANRDSEPSELLPLPAP